MIVKTGVLWLWRCVVQRQLDAFIFRAEKYAEQETDRRKQQPQLTQCYRSGSIWTTQRYNLKIVLSRLHSLLWSQMVWIVFLTKTVTIHSCIHNYFTSVTTDTSIQLHDFNRNNVYIIHVRKTVSLIKLNITCIYLLWKQRLMSKTNQYFYFLHIYKLV